MSSSNSTFRASQNSSSLSTMKECTEDLRPAIPPPTEGICNVFQINFGEHNNDDGAINTDEFQNDENNEIVQTPCPGAHTFHRACLLSWFGSIHDKRTQCPNCNEMLRRSNLLTPAQVAEQEADKEQQFAEVINLDRGRFAALIAETDRAFEDHRRVYGVNRLMDIVYNVQNRHHENAGGITRRISLPMTTVMEAMCGFCTLLHCVLLIRLVMLISWASFQRGKVFRSFLSGSTISRGGPM